MRRSVSATPTSSDGASATARTRRSRGSNWTPIRGHWAPIDKRLMAELDWMAEQTRADSDYREPKPLTEAERVAEIAELEAELDLIFAPRARVGRGVVSVRGKWAATVPSRTKPLARSIIARLHDSCQRGHPQYPLMISNGMKEAARALHPRSSENIGSRLGAPGHPALSQVSVEARAECRQATNVRSTYVASSRGPDRIRPSVRVTAAQEHR
jgi:hypothetical protein